MAIAKIFMPIGVPRIIYCWGEELPAQWTDIYNFIFRRRMVFLMQYLDDELCNQICGLLINIHMEDRSKELEKKEMEKSGLFKNTRTSGQQNTNASQSLDGKKPSNSLATGKKLTGSHLEGTPFPNLAELDLEKKKGGRGPSFEDLLAADEDLGIEENNTLEQFTLQKITMEWLNWNAQFFDYSDEPYLFYLAEMLSKDFDKGEARMLYSNDNNEMSILMNLFKNLGNGCDKVSDPTDGEVFSKNSSNLLGAKVSKTKPAESYSFFGNSSLQFTQQFFDKIAISEKTHVDYTGPALQSKKSTSMVGKSSKSSPEQSLPLKKSAVGEAYKPFSTGNTSSISGTVQGFTQQQKPSSLMKKNHLDVYSPFRLLANFAAQDYSLKDINPNLLLGNQNLQSLPQGLDNSKMKLLELFNTTLKNKTGTSAKSSGGDVSLNTNLDVKGKAFLPSNKTSGGFPHKKQNHPENKNFSINNNMPKLLTNLAHKNFMEKSLTSEKILKSSEKGLSQRILKKEYAQDKNNISLASPKSLNYLDFYSYKDSYNEFKNTKGSGSRQASLQEEEAKKVFVIINSFGGSVGNGITVHDALQFIKAGSLTLGLGVAASAASLALAGGTIGERYVTEGCHVMIHQPEGGIQGQASDIWIDSQEIMKIRLDVAEIYSLATYRPRHKILRDLDRDFYLTATETIHYGLADEIATNEVMHSIIEMTSKVWDYHDSKQQRLLESRESSNSGLDTQAQN